MIKTAVRKVYHRLEENYLTFRMLIWMRESGIVKRYGFPISVKKEKEFQSKPTEQMLESKKFYTENKDRIRKLNSLLADEKSKAVVGGGMELSHQAYSLIEKINFYQ